MALKKVVMVSPSKRPALASGKAPVQTVS